MLYQGGEREKYTHLRWVDMCKWQRVIPKHKGSPRYRIAHGWKIEYGSFNLEALKFLMHFREPGSSPLNSKIASYLPPLPCLDVCSSSSKEVTMIR
jgi:hypothetical protein